MKHGKKKKKEIRSFFFVKNRKQTKTARKKDFGSARHMDDKVVVFPTLSYVTEKIMTKEGRNAKKCSIEYQRSYSTQYSSGLKVLQKPVSIRSKSILFLCYICMYVKRVTLPGTLLYGMSCKQETWILEVGQEIRGIWIPQVNNSISAGLQVSA